jgi:integrase
MGSVYQRGNVYWIKYYRHGKALFQSSHSKKKEVATRLLKQKEGEIAKGEIPSITFEKVSFTELVDDLKEDYRINQRKSLWRVEISVKHLTKFFGRMKVAEITTDLIKEYTSRRLKSGMGNSTVNRELAALKRTFHLARQCTPPKVGIIPYIPMLKENNTRKGFFELKDFLAVRGALPFPLNVIATFAFRTGWRKSEILGLTWDRVDLKEGIVTLNPGETKNSDGRTLYLDEELLKEMHFLYMNRVKGCSFVFHRDGERVKDFRGAWNKACEDVGLEGKIFHDFRRTAVRDMIRSGIPERVAMQVSGHRSRNVFDRYHIVNSEDLKEASRKHHEYLKKLAVRADGYNLVTVEEKVNSSKNEYNLQPFDFTQN